MTWRKFYLALALSCLSVPAFAECGATGLFLQVLGSGGPAPDVGRASSSYLVWVDGKARLMVDAGGGAFLRFAESKARLEDLDAILLTHLHADHAGELPTLLKGAFFTQRTRPLTIVGPAGGGQFPGVQEFLRDLLNPGTGAFRYLSGYLEGSDGLFKLDIQQIDSHKGKTSQLKLGDIQIQSVGVEHGAVPALGYLITLRGKTLAFSGDQNGNNPAFGTLIKQADRLVMTHAVPEATDEVAARLHARPSEIGALAQTAGVKQLLLSHLMQRSLATLDANLKGVRARYTGEVQVAQDLMCLPM